MYVFIGVCECICVYLQCDVSQPCGAGFDVWKEMFGFDVWKEMFGFDVQKASQSLLEKRRQWKSNRHC